MAISLQPSGNRAEFSGNRRKSVHLRVADPNPLLRTLSLACLACLALFLTSCGERPSQTGIPAPSETKAVGFEATVSGAYEGKVSGTGVLVLLPEAGFAHQGYFFVADGQGIRAHGLTFVLPRGIAPGKHTLESPAPLNIGTAPSVRVDRDMGDSVSSSQLNTSGFLDLIAFPHSENQLSGSDVTGSFEFETEDLRGRRISVSGRFSFTVK